MLRLFTTVYPERDPSRLAEYAECLARNLACWGIDEIGLLAEGGTRSPQDSSQIRLRPIGRRPTYSDFFSWINDLADPDDISIIANTDIYFDNSLRLLDALLTPDRCLALSRWDIRSDGSPRLFERGDSQDCWIFRGPIRPGVTGDFPLGVYDCDNKIAWELEQAGYEVRNPSLSLRTYHLHRGSERSYDPDNPPDHGIHPPFRYVEPDNAGSLLFCFRLWRRYRPGYFPWRMTWNRFLHTPIGNPVRYLRDGIRRRFG